MMYWVELLEPSSDDEQEEPEFLQAIGDDIQRLELFD